MNVEHLVVCASRMKGQPSEDAYAIEEARDGRLFFAAIADGHGEEVDDEGRCYEKSATVARFAERIASGLRERFAECPDPALFPTIFDLIAQRVDAEFRPLCEREHVFASLRVGAVVSCLTIVNRKIHLAQTGDCRLYMAADHESGFTQLTQDHDCYHADELARLKPLFDEGSFDIYPSYAEGFVDPGALRRRLCRLEEGRLVIGLLPTRSFGDWPYQPAVVHAPELRTFELASVSEGTVFALCSDGGNRYVENVFGKILGRQTSIPLAQLVQLTHPLLDVPTDDVTIIYFRVTS